MASSLLYPWYELVQTPQADEKGKVSESLDQGDILFNCPVLALSLKATYPLPLPPNKLPADELELDVLILTQTCDFAQGRAANVLVCRLADASSSGKSKKEEIIKGRQPRYAMLEKSSFAEREMGLRIVDLSDIYQLPIEFVRQVAASQTPRLRLLPPYREHISQAFARFWMRIGFPQDIKLD